MIKNSLIFSPLLIIVAVLSSCSGNVQKSSNNDIESVSYSYSAGRGGSESIVATKDSLVATSLGGMFQDRPNFERKISSEDWKKITDLIKTDVLANAQNGKTRGHFDGADKKLDIKTKNKEFHLVNVQDAASMKLVADLESLLKKIAAEQK